MDLTVDKGGTIEPGSYGKVICKGSAEVKGSIEAEELSCKGTLLVQGNLTARRVKAKGIKAREVNVEELKTGFLDAGNVMVTDLEASGIVRVSTILDFKRGSIGGSVSCLTFKAEEALVKGSLSAIEVDAVEVNVNGSMEIERGSIKLANVGGSAKIGDCNIVSIKVGGTLRVVGNSEIGEGEATMASIKGSLKGQSLRVMEVLTVEGSLDIRKLWVGGAIKAKGRLNVDEADIWGKGIGKVEGRRITIRREAMEVRGDLVNLIGAKVKKVSGRIVKIDSSDVGSVEASEVEVRGRSKVNWILADRVYIIEGEVGEIDYREKLLASPKAKIGKARKVSL